MAAVRGRGRLLLDLELELVAGDTLVHDREKFFLHHSFSNTSD